MITRKIAADLVILLNSSISSFLIFESPLLVILKYNILSKKVNKKKKEKVGEVVTNLF